MSFASKACDASPNAPRRRARRRVAALTASGLFHVVVGLAIFGAASGDLVSGGGPAGGDGGVAINVTLVGSDLRSPAAATGAALALKMRPDGMSDHPLVAPVTPDDPQMSRLLQGLRSKVALEKTLDSGARAEGPQAAKPRFDGLGEIDRALHGPEGASASTGGLWGQVAPCWRTLPVAAQTPVSLEVVLDATGTLTRPPRVIRPPSEPVPDARLKAEARALAALSACMPRNDLRFAGGTYRLEFGPGR
jgi:hypothetical protein